MKTSNAIWLVLGLASSTFADDVVRFNRDVRPILAEHCWQCHGFDPATRESGLRLDHRPGALKSADSGETAIVPHHPETSELVTRISSEDPNTQMPPPEFDRPLSQSQIDILTRWIKQGAEYERHWAFEPLSKPVVPESDEFLNPIDAFVSAKLKAEGLAFSPEATRETLLRRVSLDLTGLPPTIEDQNRPDATWDAIVNRLLASPHFGERMAVDWLDAARYADTNGYFGDKPRQMWLWREWVINAYNSGMPFDQFTVEQLAGDLIPNATVSQRVATGFNRNHVANNETGIIDEEFRTEYVVDRVDTTMTTWLGLTVGCAQCHDHKYDPVSQREFYQLFAIFNNVPETGLIHADDPPPVMTVSTPEQDRQIANLAAATAAASKVFEALRDGITTQISSWESDAVKTLPVAPIDQVRLHHTFDEPDRANIPIHGTTLKYEAGIRQQAGRFDATQHVEHVVPEFNADAPWSIGFWVKPDGSLSCPLSKIQPEGDRRGLEIIWQKGRVAVNLVSLWGVNAIELTTRVPVASRRWHHIVICSDGSKRADGIRISVNGTLADVEVHRDSLSGSMQNDLPFLIGRRDSGLGYYGLLDEIRVLQTCVDDATVTDWFHGERIRGIIEIPAASRTSHDADALLDYYIQHHANDATREAWATLKSCKRAERSIRNSIPTTLVMEEMPQPRTTHVLLRGQYDEPGEVVQPEVPAALSSWPADEPRNRLGFARWLISPDNPLTARVAVNRLWAMCFGEGLVRTPNDFGTQGAPPTHPELLDWLAVTFIESGWDVKAMLRLIVSSRTYRQDSSLRMPSLAMRDPQNRWLSRGPAFRMSAEMIRDQALAVSGLLRRQIGGPSVKPYQPPGLWEEVSYNAEDSYIPDTGDGLWRRTIYTYLKRQAPPPSFLAFDGTTREKCTVRRSRTNTPLQSLILLNDPTYVEAARSLAIIVLRKTGDDRTHLNDVFRRVLCRTPDDEELAAIDQLLNRQRKRFQADKGSAKKVLATGASVIPPSVLKMLGAAELAAWTIVAHTILNLDEAITRR